MKHMAITILLMMLLITGPLAYWKYSGADEVVAWREGVREAGGVEYVGTSSLTLDQLDELTTYLEDYPDNHTLEVVDSDPAAVAVHYQFLSADDFVYLDSQPFPAVVAFAGSAVRVLVAVGAIVFAMYIFVKREMSRPVPEREEQVE